MTLRGAGLREKRRAEILHRGAGAALGALDEAGIEVTVVGGVEFAERAWPRPDLRHTHDLDLLVAESEIGTAAAVLRQLGGVGPAGPGRRGDLRLTRLEGAPVCLHTTLFAFRGPTPPLEEISARSEQAQIGGVPVQVLARDDALLRAIGQGICARPGPKWVPDAWFAANAGPTDWERLADTAERSRLAVVTHAALGYLAQALGLEVPARRPRAAGGGRRRAPTPPSATSSPWRGCGRGGSADGDPTRGRCRGPASRWRAAPPATCASACRSAGTEP